MSTILDRIVAHKKLEVERRRERFPITMLRDSVGYGWARRSLSASISNSKDFGIIAEFKRKSPSQQDINLGADPAQVTAGYARAGAAGISCLTDVQFFGAHPTDIDVVRQTVDLPVIRKDFIVDTYQLHEARAMGADAILLIAACLSSAQLDELAAEAKSLGLEVLCEVHSAEEVKLISPHVDVVGVNNRNLKDFSVSIATSLELAEMLPRETLKISESGIEDPQSIVRLKRAGFSGFLIGTYFMRQENPGDGCANFIREVHEINELYDGAIA
ncbi:indole-3-glycerol phosphate synthase TrpC [Lewinella sp. W8]|uniref:indole-3-glycerol phosphate synthase TrpC n=1 Tax=Lewinella sp. W8 TaxID=2528208 RepID=UPI0010680641|nr:indole-3-glycerol phosphate synthase TrpC [Lewinella sp. W8]MTB51349.1 indole-3-glycerol phosphate synthase TrpC [Lewinella sp. W8]